MSRLLLKSHSDPATSKAYADCFALLTKHYYDQGSRKSLTKAYKGLVNKLLAGRVLAGSGLNSKFLQNVFEKCPALAWSLHDQILKCFLPKEGEGKKESGSRSNHQRLQAMDLYQLLIMVARTDAEAKTELASKLELLSGVTCKVVEASDSWQQKKVKKTGTCIGLFAKAAKTLLQQSEGAPIDFDRQIVTESGLKLIKAIEVATEKDKTMSNLKGKSKEIKKLIQM